MNKKEKYDKLYLDIATRVSEMSHATRKKVGAVIVKDGNIISFGWNGTNAGADNCCEDSDGVTLPNVIHAEQNALYKLARSSESAVGSVLYCTLSPCVTCALGIIQAGITKVVYSEEYSDIDGVEALIIAGVEVRVLEDEKVENIEDQTLTEKYTNHIWEMIKEGVYTDSWATWMFDCLGRYPNEDYFDELTVKQYNDLLDRSLEALQALFEVFGRTEAEAIYKDWKEGNHDT